MKKAVREKRTAFISFRITMSVGAVVGPLLEHWAVGIGIVASLCLLLIGLVLLLLLGSRAQGRLVARGLFVVQLVPVFNLAQAGLHQVELGRCDDIFVTRGKNRGDFLLGFLDAVGRR